MEFRNTIPGKLNTNEQNNILFTMQRLESLKAQLEEDYPVERSSLFSTWRQKDIDSLIVAEKELVEFEAKRNVRLLGNFYSSESSESDLVLLSFDMLLNYEYNLNYRSSRKFSRLTCQKLMTLQAHFFGR